MNPELDTSRPLFLQVKQAIEEDIITGLLRPDEQIPSNSQLVVFFGLNPVTVHKGVSLLLDEGIVYKKRGLGLFVAPGAPALLRQRSQEAFAREYTLPLVAQARMLGITCEQVCQLIRQNWQDGETDGGQSVEQPAGQLGEHPGERHGGREVGKRDGRLNVRLDEQQNENQSESEER